MRSVWWRCLRIPTSTVTSVIDPTAPCAGLLRRGIQGVTVCTAVATACPTAWHTARLAAVTHHGRGRSEGDSAHQVAISAPRKPARMVFGRLRCRRVGAIRSAGTSSRPAPRPRAAQERACRRPRVTRSPPADVTGCAPPPVSRRECHRATILGANAIQRIMADAVHSRAPPKGVTLNPKSLDGHLSPTKSGIIKAVVKVPGHATEAVPFSGHPG